MSDTALDFETAPELTGPDEESGAPAPEALVGDAVACGRFVIYPSKPLPRFDTPGATAYAAEDSKNPSRQMFARVCDPNVFPRFDALLRLKMLRGASLMQAAYCGPVTFAEGDETRFATLFDKPAAAPLMPSIDARIKPIPSEQICRNVLAPAARTLALFAQRSLTHRAIRPDGIFFSSIDDTCELGECVSTPPAWGQPAFLEPVEVMMCDRAARGPGTIFDDVYALGATILVLCLGFNPTRALSDEEVLEAKLDLGSYAALLQGEHVPRDLREPIRGLLLDDEAERWSFDDIERWLTGTLRRSAQPGRTHRSDRSFFFGNTEFQNGRVLAHAFSKNWEEAAEAICSPAFETWLRRGIGDIPPPDDAELVELAPAKPPQSPAKKAALVSRVCLHLDPTAPIRYRGLAVTGNGLGTVVGMALATGQQDVLNTLRECIDYALVEEWFELQSGFGRVEISNDRMLFDRARRMLRKNGPGYGIERFAYELDRNLPCMSDILRGRRIADPHDILRVLEALVETYGGLDAVIDRHLPAYLATHMKRTLDHQLAEIASGTGSSPTAKLGMVRLLAEVQSASGPSRVPSLTQWLAAEVRPMVKQLRSRTLRDKAAERLTRAAVSGQLDALQQCLADPKLWQRDARGYAQASKQYAAAEREISELQSKHQDDKTEKLGLSLAAGVCCALAACAVIAVALY